MHWLNTKNIDRGFFQHPKHIQANQLPADERTKYIEKWRDDWVSFFRERSRELVKNGALFLANLTDLGDKRWPASAGYYYLRDICHELYSEGHISDDEFNAFFIPGYFATPDEMRSFFNDDKIKRCFDLRHCNSLTVPCAYSERVKDRLDNPQTRADLAGRLAHVVRAWSESSVRSGLLQRNENMIEEVYKQAQGKVFGKSKALAVSILHGGIEKNLAAELSSNLACPFLRRKNLLTLVLLLKKNQRCQIFACRGQHCYSIYKQPTPTICGTCRCFRHGQFPLRTGLLIPGRRNSSRFCRVLMDRLLLVLWG